MKHLIYWLLPLLIVSCTPHSYTRLAGETQGTIYHITYLDPHWQNLREQVDSVLRIVDHSMSTYISSSLISRFNSDSSSGAIDLHMIRVLCCANEIYKESKHAFDPTIMPLVRYWGFGPKIHVAVDKVDSNAVDSLLQCIGMDHLYVIGRNLEQKPLSAICKQSQDSIILYKDDPRISIDLNAIAQGYSVDLISALMDEKGITNYMVEVGGELRCSGNGPKGKGWRIGIDEPLASDAPDRPLASVVTVSNRSLATSGNYRKFYNVDGHRYGHTIDPVSGYPAISHLLSATIMAETCTEADGYATASMVLGLSGAKHMINDHPGLDAYLIYSDRDSFRTWSTPGMKKIMADNR